jgi:hypothetical protein
MKRGIFFALAAVLVLRAGAAMAHAVTVDGDPADWTMAPPTGVNTGQLGRNAALQGEYVWLDQSADERTDFAAPDTRVDMTQLRVTADGTRLYFLVRMTNIDLATGDGAPQVQIAIDRDNVSGSGEPNFGQFVDTQTAALAEWEYLVVTRFGSGNQPYVYNTTWTDVSGGLAVSSISAANDVIEISVPWSIIGNAPTAPLHFTVITARADTTDGAWDISLLSDALDALTSYGDPGTTGNTFTEVTDGDVDYFFELWFHLDPDTEPSPPLVVNEVMYDPIVAEPQDEWIEVYNRTSVNGFDIAGFKVGDEETVNGGEGMRAFPGGATAAANDVVVVANRGNNFFALYGFDADFEITASVAGVPDMLPYALWATGAVNLAGAGDEVLILDVHDTVIDVLVYGSGTYPGVVTHAVVAEGHTLERPEPQGDSNDCSADFIDQTFPTPGALLAKKALGNSCVLPIECLSGFCADGVCCDDACDGTCEGTCDTAGHCQAVICPPPANDCQLATCSNATACFVAADTPCADSVPGDCNDALCDGAGACNQTAAFEASTYACRPAAGGCDLPETCTGTSGNCPGDGFRSSTYECRTSAGDCDPAESCTGSSAACPTDSLEPSTTVCRTPAGGCDVAERCTGTAPTCPADALEPPTTVCRADTGACDVAENCTGTTATCPTDAYEPSATVCRAEAGDCDVAETCTGTTPACPTDAFEPSVLQCRAEAGMCDLPEFCSGTTAACPTDAFRASAYECRASTGACDSAETCTGSTAACPADVYEPSTTVCRDAADPCDAPESCTGTTGTCPTDAQLPDGTDCDDEDPCTEDDACNAGVCGGTAKDCSSLDDECHTGVCNVLTGVCEAEPVSNGTICDDGDDCTEDDTCQAGVCTPGTNVCVEEGAEPSEDAATEEVDGTADTAEDAADAPHDTPTDRTDTDVTGDGDEDAEDVETDGGTGGEKEGCGCTIVA